MYSDGAINSIVEDLISGLRCGSPYVLLTGSKLNSSGTATSRSSYDTVLYNVLQKSRLCCHRLHVLYHATSGQQIPTTTSANASRLTYNVIFEQHRWRLAIQLYNITNYTTSNILKCSVIKKDIMHNTEMTISYWHSLARKHKLHFQRRMSMNVTNGLM